jgi:hypothetical protein
LKLTENIIEFNVIEKDGSVCRRVVSVKKLCFGRNCSRDIEATRRNLDQKRAQGYSVHDNPNICRKGRYLLTNENVIEVQGPHTSGEVEPVIVVVKGEILFSVGSDHNDRSLETMWTETLGRVYDTAKSKQMVPAVVAEDAWRYDDLVDHWDNLILRSYVTHLNKKILYQDFPLAKLVDLEYHFRANPWLKGDGVVLFMGTSDIQPKIPTNFYPQDFHFEVHDPALKRTISHSYVVQSLEEPGSRSL